MTKKMSYAEIGQIVTGLSGLLLLGFSGYAVANLRYKVPGTGFFVALALCGALWCFGYAYEKGQTVAEGFMMAARIEYLGSSFIPTLWLLTALSWMGHPLAKSWLFRGFYLTLSCLLAGIVITNDLHHWWYQSIVPTGRVGFARYEPGPVYYLFYTFFLLTLLFSTTLLVIRKALIVHFRRKATVIVLSTLFPMAFSIAFQLGLRPGGLDLTLLSLVPAFLTVAWGLFRHDFVRIVPIARETVVESMDQAVLVFDDRGRLIDHNKAADPLLPLVEQARLTGSGPQGEMLLEIDGHPRIFRFRRSVILGPGRTEQGSVVLLSDITEEKRLLDELSHQATHDALTGIANRRHFEDHALGEVTRAVRHGGTLALVLFDLDFFKEINDRFGHPVGDTVLRSVTTVIAARLRPYDLFARIGGEEFAVLMPEAHPVEAGQAAERWRAALEATPQDLPGTREPVTASFGVATLNDLPLNPSWTPRQRLDALLSLADKALYQAKNEGRNRVCPGTLRGLF